MQVLTSYLNYFELDVHVRPPSQRSHAPAVFETRSSSHIDAWGLYGLLGFCLVPGRKAAQKRSVHSIFDRTC